MLCTRHDIYLDVQKNEPFRKVKMTYILERREASKREVCIIIFQCLLLTVIIAESYKVKKNPHDFLYIHTIDANVASHMILIFNYFP